METRPLVSVVCLCYNQQDFVIEAIQSVIYQTYSPIEIIVVDDASNDHSARMINEFCNVHPDIKFLALKINIGNCKAFNQALAFANRMQELGKTYELIIYPDDDVVLIVWDYVVGVVGVAAAITLVGAMLALLRNRQAREQGFGDSLRDHLRRRLAQLDDEATGESRVAFITLVAGLIFMWAIPTARERLNDVPWSEIYLPSPLVIVLILGFLCWVFFRSMPRSRQRTLSRRRQLEALLKELDGQ